MYMTVAFSIPLKTGGEEIKKKTKTSQATQPTPFIGGQETRESRTIWGIVSEVGHHCLTEIWLRPKEILELEQRNT